MGEKYDKILEALEKIDERLNALEENLAAVKNDINGQFDSLYELVNEHGFEFESINDSLSSIEESLSKAE